MTECSFNDFQRLDIRVGKITAAEQIKGKKRLIRLEVDIGEENRVLVAGIAPWYEPKELIGREIIVLVNLEPKVIGGIRSQGMLLAADSEDGPVLLSVEKGVAPGTKVR
jgi:methionine--tRNA ligase beta chain